jgi:hypothetical protein
MAVFSFFRNMVLAVVLPAAGAMSANAAIVSKSDTQSFEPFGFMVSSQTAPSAAFPDTQVLNGVYTLQQFNGALGTLNSVRIEFNQGANSALSDTGGNCAAGFAACAASLSRTFTQSGSVTLGTASATAAMIIDPNTVNCDLGGGPNACFLSNHAQTSPYTEAIDFTAASDVANFVVVGTFAVATDLIANYLATLTPESIDVVSGLEYSWGGTATVIYDYTAGSTVAMPAPAGAAFLLIGLAALARRKRG